MDSPDTSRKIGLCFFLNSVLQHLVIERFVLSIESSEKGTIISMYSLFYSERVPGICLELSKDQTERFESIEIIRLYFMIIMLLYDKPPSFSVTVIIALIIAILFASLKDYIPKIMSSDA